MKTQATRIFSIFSLLVILITSSCSSDDMNGLETVYGYTIESETDQTVINNDDDAKKMADLFITKKWVMTRTFIRNTQAESDEKAKTLFKEVVAKANQEFAIMTFNGNAKFTYKCSREEANGNKTELDVQQWKNLKQ